MKHSPVFLVAISIAGLALSATAAGAQKISTEQFAAEAAQFLEREITAHVSAIENVDPPQSMVLGVPTAGDFTWGSFMRAVAEVTALTGQTNTAGRDIAPFLGKVGLIEARLGGKTFSQLGAAITLRRFGNDLATNALWQSLSPSERDEWRALLNPERFYDPRTHRVINLPENYMGVAARIATYDYQMGLVTNRAFADDVLTHAAGQFLRGALYADDHLPTGRYDRYSQEYARFIHEAASNLGRADVLAAVEPSLKAVMQTWYALVSPEGYGYPWGRTIGAMSYMDTMEIVGFLAEHPEFRPAPLANLAGIYFAAWQSLQRDYQPDRHLLNMFGFGRGNYRYMTIERQWQQTTGFLFKSADSLRKLLAALKAENITEFPAQPELPDVARFDFYGRTTLGRRVPDQSGNRTNVVLEDRVFGGWIVRQGNLRFALPITTGVRPGIADYLPAPHGLPGLAAPVEQLVPALTPYLELEDGRTIVTGDGADEIHPGADRQSLRVVWKNWAVVNPETTRADSSVGAEPQRVETGLIAEVIWKIEGNALVRTEKISAPRETKIRRFWLLFPSTGDQVTSRLESGGRVYRFKGPAATLEVRAASPTLSFTETLQATGNSALGKGARGPIPLLLHFETTNIVVTPNAPVSWNLRLEPIE